MMTGLGKGGFNVGVLATLLQQHRNAQRPKGRTGHVGFVAKEPLGEKIEIDLPPVDDAVTYFAQSCHVTNAPS